MVLDNLDGKATTDSETITAAFDFDSWDDMIETANVYNTDSAVNSSSVS